MTRDLIFAAFVGTVPAIAACATDSDDLDFDDLDSDDPDDGEALAAVVQASESGVRLEHGEPMFEDKGKALRASGKLEGLDKKKDVRITLTAKAIAEARCKNPGGHEPPGQNPVKAQLQVKGTRTFPAKEIWYGKLAFSVTTEPPEKHVPGAPDCPNKNWTETIGDDLAFKSARLIVEQPEGMRVLVVSCMFSPRTSDGRVPSSQVDCY